MFLNKHNLYIILEDRILSKDRKVIGIDKEKIKYHHIIIFGITYNIRNFLFMYSRIRIIT